MDSPTRYAGVDWASRSHAVRAYGCPSLTIERAWLSPIRGDTHPGRAHRPTTTTDDGCSGSTQTLASIPDVRSASSVSVSSPGALAV